MNTKKIIGGVILFLCIPIGLFYWYYPRQVHFNLVSQLVQPDGNAFLSSYMGFDKVDTPERLLFYLAGDYNNSIYVNRYCYYTTEIENISEGFDYFHNDYIITYNKRLKALKHSPFLTRTNDDLHEFMEGIPLIPIFEDKFTDSVYIYSIKKNSHFRAPGP